MTIPSKVNKALKKAGFNFELVRDSSGYYYFTEEGLDIPSIYENNLRNYSSEDLVSYARKHLENPIDTTESFNSNEDNNLVNY